VQLIELGAADMEAKAEALCEKHEAKRTHLIPF
jgi:hypothetical protein